MGVGHDVEERVECAECGERYDSNEFTFCPRCGGTRAGAPAAAGVARGVDAGRRRRKVQSGGLILTIMGSVAAIAFLATVFFPAAQLEAVVPVLADQPGGELSVLVVDAGAPVANATVLVAAYDGTPLFNATTGADGLANFTLADNAAANVTVQYDGASWLRHVVVLEGGSETLEVDTSGPAEDTRWQGLDRLMLALRIFAGAMAVMALLVVAGGVAAMRLRFRHFATAGAFVGLVPTLLMFVMTLGFWPVPMTLLFGSVVALLAVATANIMRGRDLFS